MPPAQQTNSSLDAVASSTMAPFLMKLFQIVSADTTDHCITWTPKGDSFVISDPDNFAKDILPTYFKHNNIRSFIRQLNTYGFRKRTNISSTDEHLEFFHEKFKRDQPTLLMQIKRCSQPKPSAKQSQNNLENDRNAAKKMPDIDWMRSRVGELKTRLGSLQTEIRDYNSQMEYKVDQLIQVIQCNAPAETSLQLQQSLLQLGGGARGGTGEKKDTMPMLAVSPSTSVDGLGQNGSIFGSMDFGNSFGGISDINSVLEIRPGQKSTSGLQEDLAGLQSLLEAASRQ